MTLVFLDSFDHYDDADIAKKYTSTTNSPAIGTGRFGNGLVASGNSRIVTKTGLVANATYIVGFAFKYSAVPVSEIALFDFREGTTSHVDIRVTTGQRLRATRNGTSLGIGTIPIAPNVFYYIEFKATISDTVGVITTRIDGVQDLNLSSQDTRNGGAVGTIDGFRIGTLATSDSDPYTFDDLYLLDTSGSAPTNTFLGDIRVECLFPNGNGNSSVFSGSDGNSTDNYLLVDDPTAPDDDTTYVQASSVGDKDTYAFTNVTPGTGTVYGVQVGQYARKTDAGARSIASVARLSGTEVDSANFTLSTTYQYLLDMREAKPGGGAWSVSDVNSAEFGPKVTV